MGYTLDRERQARLRDRFAADFGAAGESELFWFSAPGRTEIGGNHTDHNHGLVLCGAVTLDAVALVRKTGGNRVRLHSEGFTPCELTLDALEPQDDKHGSTALIRGIAYGFKERGLNIGGFDAVTHSNVTSGSGLSSSAAYENLVATIFDHLYNHGNMNPVEKAKIGQYAENHYTGKRSGLMDQAASCCGGLMWIDFEAAEDPIVTPIRYDFGSSGHTLIVTRVGDHAGDDLKEAYNAIPEEMGAVAEQFGKHYLREVAPEEFYAKWPDLYGNKNIPDRAILRAHHFFRENERVREQVRALETGDFDGFLAAVRESGRSSYMYLQNVLAGERDQKIGVALALAERLLEGRGAARVHGGGFAGTIQAFVPDDLADRYVGGMDSVFGSGACARLSIRYDGGIRIK